jgi:uncharacterized protein YbcI
MERVDGHVHRGEDGHVRRGVELENLSREMVRLYKDLFGRGPTKAKSAYADGDTIIVTLEQSLTAAERKMVELGEHQRLQETRLFFQQASRDQFMGIVEHLTGRTVRGFVSGMDSDKDISTEVFYLVPEGR